MESRREGRGTSVKPETGTELRGGEGRKQNPAEEEKRKGPFGPLSYSLM